MLCLTPATRACGGYRSKDCLRRHWSKCHPHDYTVCRHGSDFTVALQVPGGTAPPGISEANRSNSQWLTSIGDSGSEECMPTSIPPGSPKPLQGSSRTLLPRLQFSLLFSFSHPMCWNSSQPSSNPHYSNQRNSSQHYSNLLSSSQHCPMQPNHHWTIASG